MGIAQAAAVAEPQVIVPIAQTTKAILTFNDLWIGDRFQPMHASGHKYPIYTKTRHDQARCHSLESRALKRKGYGYLGDPIVSVDLNEKIRFIPLD